MMAIRAWYQFIKVIQLTRRAREGESKLHVYTHIQMGNTENWKTLWEHDERWELLLS